MTAGVDEKEAADQHTTKTTVPPDIQEIFEFLSLNNKIIFKSQQIDDPELQRSEKLEIAKEIFERNRQIFLQRFGGYFEEQQLKTFEHYLVTAANWNEHESVEEIQDMLLDYSRRLQTRNRDVKNRRYTAMQSLIKEGEYFSEIEMMKRAPELYQELVGQYLSAEEIKQRDSYDVKNTTFSGIFMHQLEQQQKEEIMKSVENKLENDREDSNDKYQQAEVKVANTMAVVRKKANFVEEVDSDEDDQVEMNTQMKEDDKDFEVPTPCRLQWGNFDNENIACSTSRLQLERLKDSDKKSAKRPENDVFITAGERNLLRQEFIDIMHQQFLAGKDENFDYVAVDENTQLDDLAQINQDKEDAYFATSDEGEDNDQQLVVETTNNPDTDSEDELDVYMRHLNQHHSLKY